MRLEPQKRDFYSYLRPLLFCLDPERAHRLTIRLLQLSEKINLLKFPLQTTNAAYSFFKLHFPNRVGIAAGFDKNGECIDALLALGFGFVEVGTVTPKPQNGNPRPRLFRIPEAAAVINRMGLNNEGVDALVLRLQRRKRPGILGVNIGKNKDTSLDQAEKDYVYCLEKAYAYADYVVINVSSPNTEGLRDLQTKTYLEKLLLSLKNAQKRLADQQKRFVPLLIKVAPDLGIEELKMLLGTARTHEIDGIIATNTTLDKNAVQNFMYGNEAGGLSGKPLCEKSAEIIRLVRRYAGNDWPIIGVGGIFSKADAEVKIQAGANLIQVYTGLIYKGPKLIQDLL